MTNPLSPYEQVKAALDNLIKYVQQQAAENNLCWALLAKNQVLVKALEAQKVLPSLKPAAQPDKAAVERVMAQVERANYRPREYATVVIERTTLSEIITNALAALPQAESRLVKELQAELRHFKGRPAVDGKPLELQSRDELLAAVHGLQAENVRLELALTMADGTSPCSKWKENQHVDSLEDFAWWVDSKLREYLLLAAKSKDPELTDWVAARKGTFEEVKLNLARAIKAQQAVGAV